MGQPPLVERGGEVRTMKVSRCNFNFLFLFIIGFCVVSFFGCASLGVYNAATGRNEFIFIPTDSEVAMGHDIHQKLINQYSLADKQQQWTRLKRIGNRLAQVSDRQDYEYHFYLLENSELNAFTTPGGNVYVFTGLMDKLKTDDQIAAVLAHEIGHCAARHTIKKFQAALGYNLIEGIVFSQLEGQDQVKQVAALSTGVVMNLIFSSYSRRDESEADRLGVKYMYLAGFDLNGMIETLEILKKESKPDHVSLSLRTHPYLDDRIVAVKKEVEKVKAQEP